MSKRWKPKQHEVYFRVQGDARVVSDVWAGGTFDERYLASGNCFETREQAEAAAAKIKELLLGMSSESATSSAPLPKLTEEVFNHPACPEWAQYAAVNKDGKVVLFPHAPSIMDNRWCSTYYTSSARAAILDDRTFDSTDWQHSLIERPKKSLPRLTEEVFNRPDCPEWASYAAVDAAGEVWAFALEPYLNDENRCWVCQADDYESSVFITAGYDATDWQNSLTERPERSFPKLTKEVFDRQDCPEWAKYAAVANSGYAYWFKDKPRPGIEQSTTSNLVTWTLYDSKQPIPGLWDSSAWQDSLIERPKPKLTEEVFNRPGCPKNVQYAVVTSEGRVVGYTSKPYINKEYDCWGFNEGCSFTVSVAGTFDSTDWQNSLVERPIKLPDWCKAGEWAYSTVYNEYVKISDIDEFDVEFDRGAYCTVSYKSFLEDYKQARPRPYNAEEMQKLVGKVLELDGNRDLVISYDEYSESVYADAMWMNSDELLSSGYTIDGELCGVFEHLEDGEWVK
jgi:hypothetical protein